jgi:hypothetical protein
MILLIAAWFAQDTSGLLGGAIGIAGAIFGTIAGVGAGRLRTPAHFAAMRGFFLFFIALGIALLITAAIALTRSQPYHVWYPFGLGGLILTILPAALLPVLRARQRAIEQQRLEGEAIRRA